MMVEESFWQPTVSNLKQWIISDDADDAEDDDGDDDDLDILGALAGKTVTI